MKHLIGKGRLTWDRSERIDGRYGFIYLTNSGDSLSVEPTDYALLNIPYILERKKGRLIALVTQARKSTHVGDILRDHYPETPKVGEEIVLGEGAFVISKNWEDQPMIGLKPKNASRFNPDTFTDIPIDSSSGFRQHHRNAYRTPWLDPKALYRAHEQTVELYFESDK